MHDDRISREREFHDALFAEDAGERPAGRFYAVNAPSHQFFCEQIDTAPRGGRVLDYGCGHGAYGARYAAKRGYDVTAVDLSPVAIERARAVSEQDGVADRIDFREMDAEQLDFPADHFDMVCGSGVIHHLALDRCLPEIARALRPDGVAVFAEPLGHNPVINAYRNRTPEQRSVDEHPLLMRDLDIARRYFGEVEPTYFHLLDLLAVPLRGRGSFASVRRTLRAADRRLFEILPIARRFAWQTVLRLSAPK